MGPEKCPFCGQEIDTESARCFFCGADLDETSVERRLEQLQTENNKKSALKARCPLVLKIAVVVILICIALFSSTSKRNPKSSEASLPEGSTSMVRLNAKVTFTGAKFIISNNDSFDWINVELRIMPETIGSNFSLRVLKIPAGEEQTVRAAEFTMHDGTNFNPYTMKPKRFWIWCDTPTRENGSYFAGWK